MEPTTLLLNKGKIVFEEKYSRNRQKKENRGNYNSFSDYQSAVISAEGGKREMRNVPF